MDNTIKHQVGKEFLNMQANFCEVLCNIASSGF